MTYRQCSPAASQQPHPLRRLMPTDTNATVRDALTDTGRSRLLYAAIDARSFPLRLRGAAVCFAIHDVTLSIVSDRGARPFLMR